MTPGSVSQVRLFCTCGQKMRITPDMYGRAGRCVSCGQKLWIPRREDIAPNTTRIDLKDHPELLRKTGDAPRAAAKAKSTSTEKPSSSSADAAVPLDTLDPLQVLCNSLFGIERLMAAGQENTAALEKKRDALIEARAGLNEALEQRLMESAVDLASCQERSKELVLAARVGELEFFAYRNQIERLRSRRDTLERRQENLRAWRVVQSPFATGGLIDTDLSQIPKSVNRLSLPNEEEAFQPRLDRHIRELREALYQRQYAEMHLAELEKAGEKTAVPDIQEEDKKAQHRADRNQAVARIGFIRGRLEQFDKDLVVDLDVHEAQLELLRSRRQIGELDHAAFARLEREFDAARVDLGHAREIIYRASNANSSQDVPNPRGSFLERVASTGPRRHPAERWLTPLTTAAFLVSFFLPLAAGERAFAVLPGFISEPTTAALLSGLPVLLAIATVLAALIGNPVLRGLAFALTWLVAVVGGVAFAHEAELSLSSLGDAVRLQGLLSGPAALSYLAGVTLVTGLMMLLLIKRKAGAVVLPVLIAMACLGVAGVLTDYLGMASADPYVDTVRYVAPRTPAGRIESNLLVKNAGWRPAVLVPSPSAKPNHFMFSIEADRAGTWEIAGAPAALEIENSSRMSVTGDMPLVAVRPGAYVELSYLLAPGKYRALLDDRVVYTFDVQGEPLPEPLPEETSVPVAVTPAIPPQTGVPAEIPAVEEPSPHVDEQGTPLSEVAVELRGVLSAAGREPEFSFYVYLPNTDPQQLSTGLGGDLYDGWQVTEYNPDTETVTLLKGDQIYIVRRKERRTLPLVIVPDEATQE